MAPWSVLWRRCIRTKPPMPRSNACFRLPTESCPFSMITFPAEVLKLYIWLSGGLPISRRDDRIIILHAHATLSLYRFRRRINHESRYHDPLAHVLLSARCILYELLTRSQCT